MPVHERTLSDREISLMLESFHEKNEILFERVHEKLDAITAKQDYTNGNVRRLYLYLTVLGSIVATLLFTNGKQFLAFIKLIAF